MFLVIIVSIIAFAYFFPNAFTNIKYGIVDVMSKSNSTESLKYTETALGLDYGKPFGFIGCDSDDKCVKYFRLEGMLCSPDKTCYIPYGEAE